MLNVTQYILVMITDVHQNRNVVLGDYSLVNTGIDCVVDKCVCCGSDNFVIWQKKYVKLLELYGSLH